MLKLKLLEKKLSVFVRRNVKMKKLNKKRDKDLRKKLMKRLLLNRKQKMKC